MDSFDSVPSFSLFTRLSYLFALTRCDPLTDPDHGAVHVIGKHGSKVPVSVHATFICDAGYAPDFADGAKSPTGTTCTLGEPDENGDSAAVALWSPYTDHPGCVSCPKNCADCLDKETLESDTCVRCYAGHGSKRDGDGKITACLKDYGRTKATPGKSCKDIYETVRVLLSFFSRFLLCFCLLLSFPPSLAPSLFCFLFSLLFFLLFVFGCLNARSFKIVNLGQRSGIWPLLDQHTKSCFKPCPKSVLRHAKCRRWRRLDACDSRCWQQRRLLQRGLYGEGSRVQRTVRCCRQQGHLHIQR